MLVMHIIYLKYFIANLRIIFLNFTIAGFFVVELSIDRTGFLNKNSIFISRISMQENIFVFENINRE